MGEVDPGHDLEALRVFADLPVARYWHRPLLPRIWELRHNLTAYDAVYVALARFSHHLTVEARNRPAITALRLLAVLNGLFKYARIIQAMRRRAARALY